MCTGSMRAFWTSRRRTPRWRLRQAGRLGVIFALLVAGCAAEPRLDRDAERLVDEYLAALSGASADRGWSLLLPITRETTFEDDRDSYVAEAEAHDWSSFSWSVTEIERDEPFTYEVWVTVDGLVSPALALVTSAETTHGPVFSVRFGAVFGGDGIWMVEGIDERELP